MFLFYVVSFFQKWGHYVFKGGHYLRKYSIWTESIFEYFFVTGKHLLDHFWCFQNQNRQLLILKTFMSHLIIHTILIPFITIIDKLFALNFAKIRLKNHTYLTIIQGVSHRNWIFKLALRERKTNIFFDLWCLVASGGADICVSSTSFQKNDIGWPQQPLVERSAIY